eukprot:491351_1
MLIHVYSYEPRIAPAHANVQTVISPNGGIISSLIINVLNITNCNGSNLNNTLYENNNIMNIKWYIYEGIQIKEYKYMKNRMNITQYIILHYIRINIEGLNINGLNYAISIISHYNIKCDQYLANSNHLDISLNSINFA